MSERSALIHLGFEVDSGAQIAVPLKHLAICGQTQESGKTTTLEALITRSQLRALAFITKRGERSFETGRRVAPYFMERVDWEFVESILEATMRQRMKFERAWIVKATKGAHTLAGVQKNVAELQARSKRSMDQDLYMLLGEYLQKVVPLIARLPKSDRLALEPGLNVMDLRDYPDELQWLVISSAVRWIHQNENHVITVVPEAWKFAPQGRNTPVKHELVKLVREGAGLKNYVWIDSQDIAGVEKELLRAAAVWLLGVQREANEIERALKNIPRGIKKPDAAALATLKLGEFYACWGEHVHKVYVQPEWMNDAQARAVAKGKLSAGALAQAHEELTRKKQGETMDYEQLWKEEKKRGDDLAEEVRELRDQVGMLLRGGTKAAISETEDAKKETSGAQAASPAAFLTPEQASRLPDHARSRSYSAAESLDNEQLYQAIKKRLLQEAPALIKLLADGPEIAVTVQRRTIAMDDSTIKGKIAILISEGWLDQERTAAEVHKELLRRGLAQKTPAVRVWEAMKEFAAMGFFYATDDKKYHTTPRAKVSVVAA